MEEITNTSFEGEDIVVETHAEEHT